jgi:hypothetical protein
MANVTDNLVDVQFYTSLDPYYYVVDNRPLKDLDDNIRLVAAASDASTGSADRAALSGASIAYGQLGYGKTVSGDPTQQSQGMFAANYTLSGFELRISHGYLVRPVSRGGVPTYFEPVLAVHDAITSLVCQVGRGGTVQVSYRDSTVSDRIGSGASKIQVAQVSFKQGTGPGVFPLPDTGNIALMHIDVPAGALALSEDHITLINMKTLNQISDVISSYKLVYTSYLKDLNAGLQTVSLEGSGIDNTRMEAVEVFVQGVNQFNWTYNSGTNSITLEAPVSQTAGVRIRQVNLQLV